MKRRLIKFCIVKLMSGKPVRRSIVQVCLLAQNIMNIFFKNVHYILSKQANLF